MEVGSCGESNCEPHLWKPTPSLLVSASPTGPNFHDLGLDLAHLIEAKLEKNEARYPVEKSRGRSTKYTNL